MRHEKKTSHASTKKKKIFSEDSQKRVTPSLKNPTVIQRRFFQNSINAWYQQNRRDLPWRRTQDPYRIVVSEVMLQQTQVDRVRPKYEEFLRMFPTLTALARAPRASVLRIWAGMGYNRRAVYLSLLARHVVRSCHGRIPRTEAALTALPGIGTYTARAIMTFAYHRRVAAIDTNQHRVFSRYYYGNTVITAPRIARIATLLLPQRTSDRWNHALMDFGALVCTSKPRCDRCPLFRRCRAYPTIRHDAHKKKRASQPFFDSNRFYRGRIVDLLRSRPVWTRHALLHHFQKTYSVPATRVRMLLDDLQRDGVCTQKWLKKQKVVCLG